MFIDPCCQMATCLTNITAITAWPHAFVINKELQKFGDSIFNKLTTLKGVKTISTAKS